MSQISDFIVNKLFVILEEGERERSGDYNDVRE